MERGSLRNHYWCTSLSAPLWAILGQSFKNLNVIDVQSRLHLTLEKEPYFDLILSHLNNNLRLTINIIIFILIILSLLCHCAYVR